MTTVTHNIMIINLSYVSTGLFWRKISTANTKVAFSPLGQGLVVWEKPFYLQSHQLLPVQNHPRERHQKGLRAKIPSPEKPPTVKSSPGGCTQREAPAEVPKPPTVQCNPPTVRVSHHRPPLNRQLSRLASPGSCPSPPGALPAIRQRSRIQVRSHQLAEIARHQRIPPGVTPPSKLPALPSS
jgi:hypothetical protein